MNVLALLATLIAVVSADLSINSPIASSTWSAGQAATITWIPAGAGLEPAKQVQVDLLRGDPAALTLVSTLGTTTEGAQSFIYQVPASLASGSDYVVRIGDRYSSKFSVGGGSSPSPTPSPAPAPSPTSAAPSPTATGKPSGTQTTSSTSTSTAKPNSAVAVKVSVAAFVPVAALAITWF